MKKSWAPRWRFVPDLAASSKTSNRLDFYKTILKCSRDDFVLRSHKFAHPLPSARRNIHNFHGFLWHKGCSQWIACLRKSSCVIQTSSVVSVSSWNRWTWRRSRSKLTARLISFRPGRREPRCPWTWRNITSWRRSGGWRSKGGKKENQFLIVSFYQQQLISAMCCNGFILFTDNV